MSNFAYAIAVPQMERACAECEHEHRIVNLPGVRKSHGLCRRHMAKLLREAGIGENEIEAVARVIDVGQGWPPDLGPAPRELEATTVIAEPDCLPAGGKS